jgi:two-component sensor histidine kinase
MATNAAKYGALSVPEGRVTVSWAEAAGVLRLEWVESGGPPVVPSKRTGFGSKLIDRVLRVQLQAELELERAEEGMRLRTSIPIPQDDPKRMPMR